MIWKILKWMILVPVLALTVLVMANCTMLGMNYASLETDNKPAASPGIDVATFEAHRSAIMATLEEELYGPWPDRLPVSITSRRMIDASYLGGRGTLEEIMVTIGEGETPRTFPVVLAMPNVSGPVPLLISQTFAGNCSVFPNDPVTDYNGNTCDGDPMGGMMGNVATQIFGTFIANAPIDRYFDAGLGYASFDGSGFVPDSSKTAGGVMAGLTPGPQPTSALMAWAYAFHGVAELFGDDARVESGAIAAIGHSRFGKSALIAAAWSPRIDAAIAHQSGFGGAASSRSIYGERLDRMTKSYPHWMRPGLALDMADGWEPTYDQHYLLALAAPKPIFLGNGRRDVWSDPNSTYRMAEAADAVYEAAGVTGLPATDIRDYTPGAEISYWLRPGGHSVVSEDIDAFTAFMTAHFGGASSPQTALQTPN